MTTSLKVITKIKRSWSPSTVTLRPRVGPLLHAAPPAEVLFAARLAPPVALQAPAQLDQAQKQRGTRQREHARAPVAEVAPARVGARALRHVVAPAMLAERLEP